MVFVRVLTLPYHSAGPKCKPSVRVACVFYFEQDLKDETHIVPNKETMDFTGFTGRAGACSRRF